MREDRLVFTALRSRSYDKMVWFYRDIIGVPLHEEDHPPEGVHSEYSWHSPYFHFAIFSCAADQQPTRAELSFSTNDLGAVHARAVAAGVRVERATGLRPWGFSADYLDPDGNPVGVTEMTPGMD